MNTEWKTSRVIIDLMIETNVARDGTIVTTVINTSASNAKVTEIGTLERIAPDWRVAAGDGNTIAWGSTKAEAIKSFERLAATKAAKWAVQ